MKVRWGNCDTGRKWTSSKATAIIRAHFTRDLSCVASLSLRCCSSSFPRSRHNRCGSKSAPISSPLVTAASRCASPPRDTLGSPFFENDVIGVRVAMNVNLIVTTFVASYGVVDGVDLSIAVPVVHASVQGTSEATIHPAGYPSPHRFAGTDSAPVMTAGARMDGAATGVGGIAARLKINVAQSNSFGAAILLDGRFPTGDEENLLGSGKFSGRGVG